MAVVHHSAICVHDLDASLRFWRDGLGFEVLMDEKFHGDWPTLLRAQSSSLRAVFLGQTTSPDAGILELVEFGPTSAGSPSPTPGVAGFLLLSVMIDVEATLARLAALNLGGDIRRIEVGGVVVCTVVDPDGVVVELMDTGAAANLDRLRQS